MSVVPDSFRRYGEEPLGQTPSFRPGKGGVFESTLAREPNGETRLLHDYAKVPNHLTDTLDSGPAPGLTTVCRQESIGGVAQGNRISIDAKERALTQTTIRVHSMCSSYVHIDGNLRVEDGANLKYVPGATIVNEDTRYLQTLLIELDPAALVIVSDILVLDWLTEHESFGFNHYHSQSETYCESWLVCSDAIDLRPTKRDPCNPTTVGEFGVSGTLYVLVPSEPTDELTNPIHDRIKPIEDGSVDVFPSPYESDVSVRVLGHRSADVLATVTAAWDASRHMLLGVSAPVDRRY